MELSPPPPPPHLPQQQVLGPFELSSGRGRRHRHRRVYNRPGNGPMIMPCKSPWRCSGTDVLLYELVTEAKREQVMDQCYSKAVVLSSGRFASQGTLSNDWRPFWPGVGGGWCSLLVSSGQRPGTLLKVLQLMEQLSSDRPHIKETGPKCQQCGG